MTSTTAGWQKMQAARAPDSLDPQWVKSLDEGYAVLRQTFKSGRTKSYEWRRSQLLALEQMIKTEELRMAEAVAKDLRRPQAETLLMETTAVQSEVQHALSNLRSWMRPESVSTPAFLQPASSWIRREPKGLVHIISPYNFPFNLTFGPLIASISAGNCAAIKVPEQTEASSNLIKELCEKYLDTDACRVFLGAIPEATELLTRRWDHIFYTGNGFVGRIVMEAAAKHLCPVTLELGGKSPVVFDKGLSASQLKLAAKRIAYVGLFVNAGQICVSPDYVLVHKDVEGDLIAALKEAIQTMNPPGNSTENLGRLVHKRHYDRIKGLIDTSGGQIVCGGATAEAGADESNCFVPPTIISSPDLRSPAMAEEIFGPVISVLPVESLDAAIEIINERETPLALYVFSPSSSRAKHVMDSTNSGGVCINDAMMHLASPMLPFGGAGPSGFGAYHGKFGFDELTHKRAVLSRSLLLDVERFPPYKDFWVKERRDFSALPGGALRVAGPILDTGRCLNHGLALNLGLGFLRTLHRLQSTAAYAARQLEASMRRLLANQPQASSPEQVSLHMAKLDTHLALLGEELSNLRRMDRDEKPTSTRVEDLQKRVYFLQAQVAHVEQMAASWETVLKAGERSKMHCGVSRLQSSVQTVHRQLDELTQQAVEGHMGDPRTDPDYAPAHLEATLEAIKEEGTALDRSQQTLIAQGTAPNMDGLSDLQGRLHFFQELLRCVTEAVAKNDHGSTLQSIVRHRPQNPKRSALPPLSARSETDDIRELVEEPPLQPAQQARADLYESSPLPPDRGPAAMGRREMSLEQMREEIDEERKRYIAYHLVRDELGGASSLSTTQTSYF
ncbi:Aldh3b1 [Symbiodinium natans]|uniref:Aldh3b1 protein n=1 Tax=Symbiodinium natans TaxID=878477 RepID=A0A812MD16_9DINO|nr:Aldh3b1 [Symbiodinium natans]